MNEVEHVLAVHDELGEGPVWHADEQALYWVDIERHLVHRYHPASGADAVFDVAVPITVLRPRQTGGFVAGTAKGFAFWDPRTQALEFIAHPEADRPHNRFNDGAVDRHGRFWAGTMNQHDAAAPHGCLYRLDADGSVHTVATGFSVYNGTAWSPDGRTMYFTDTFRRVILACDYDATSGTIANQRPFAHVPEAEGYPDGHAVDSEGYVWSTHWGGWKVTRYTPTGQKEREIRLPAENVTCCAFGGEHMDELYITTARSGLDEAARARQPLAGDLFRVRVGVAGLPTPKFAG
jgi:sugar lactone lactonase YvrE